MCVKQVAMLALLGLIVVSPVRDGDMQVCGEGLSPHELVCVWMGEYSYCSTADGDGGFCVPVPRPLLGGKSFFVEAAYSGRAEVMVLWDWVYLPLVTN